MHTVENLQKAYNGESNAHARYLAFAKKADEEGYAKVASLFRAAALAEEIHAVNHSRVLRKAGQLPAADVMPPKVGTTRENLEEAIKGEEHERDVMYPEFIKVAKAEKQRAAITTFSGALAAEAEHARLYHEALDHLEEWRTKADFYVCNVCGFTTEKGIPEKCPVCKVGKEKFKTVN